MGSKTQSLSEQVFPCAAEAHAELFSDDKANYSALHKCVTEHTVPSPCWDPQAAPEPFQEQPAPTMNSKMYFNSHRGVTCSCLSICNDIPRMRTGSSLEDSGICCLCCPQPSHAASHILLSFGSDWQTPELWKGRKSLGEAQRYFYHSLWPPTPIIYIRIRMLLHREKKIKSIESSKEQFFYSSQQPVLSLVPFSMGCWLLAVCWQEGLATEMAQGKTRNSRGAQPSSPRSHLCAFSHSLIKEQTASAAILPFLLAGPSL